MPKISQTIAKLYGTSEDALEHLRDTLIAEEPYAALFGGEQLAFHDWIFANAADYIDGQYVDWVGAFYDWEEQG